MPLYRIYCQGEEGFCWLLFVQFDILTKICHDLLLMVFWYKGFFCIKKIITVISRVWMLIHWIRPPRPGTSDWFDLRTHNFCVKKSVIAKIGHLHHCFVHLPWLKPIIYNNLKCITLLNDRIVSCIKQIKRLQMLPDFFIPARCWTI